MKVPCELDTVLNGLTTARDYALRYGRVSRASALKDTGKPRCLRSALCGGPIDIDSILVLVWEHGIIAARLQQPRASQEQPQLKTRKNRLKIPLIIAAVLVVAVIAAPIWGGCGFNRQLCNSWCEVRHLGSALKKVTCKASCAADEVSCLAK